MFVKTNIARSMWVYCILIVAFTDALKVDKTKVESEWSPKFTSTFLTFADRVLNVNGIQTMLQAKNLIEPLDGHKEFKRMFDSTQVKLSDLQQAVKNLKQKLENPVAAPPPVGGPPPPRQGPTSCCRRNGPTRYEGRFRQTIREAECYGNADDDFQKLVSSDVLNTLKSNYKNFPSLSWQYFADSQGHYVQYPTSPRLCDNASSIDSPLTQEWFVEKLHMEQKNLVIVFDNGPSTNSRIGQRTRRQLLLDAIRHSLGTLTSLDKVNLVAMSSNSASLVATPAACDDKLLVATERNVDYLKDFTRSLNPATGEPNLTEGLSKAYEILKADINENPVQFEQGSNLILLVLDGTSKPTNWQTTAILDMVAGNQAALNNSVQHFVFTLGQPATQELTDRLAQIADQNNLKLNKSSGVDAKPWPTTVTQVTSGQPVGKEGTLDVLTDPDQFLAAVSTYFQKLPPQTDTELTTITPMEDKYSGVSMTMAVPVYQNAPSNVTLGVAAVDAPLAVVFSDVVHFDFGVHSYAYLIETRHGRVLLHPKLRDPGNTAFDDTLYPALDVVEPDLTAEQRKVLRTAPPTDQTFSAELRPGRSAFSSETGVQLQPQNATVHYQRLLGTSLVMVMVHFEADQEEERIGGIGVSLHAPYHRLDHLVSAPATNKPLTADICRLYGNYVSFKESVVKLAPGVFTNPELYRYSREPWSAIIAINRFLVDGNNRADIIREDLKGKILRVIKRTDGLDALWTSSSRDVIERFFGSPSGVFRVFPGLPLNNSFDHINSKWYKASVAEAGKYVFQRTTLSLLYQQEVIVVSRALTSHTRTVAGVTVPERLEGVVGMAVTPRFLTAQFVNTVEDCQSKDLQCHIVDSTGTILDDMLSKTRPGERHLVSVYPWLSTVLSQKQVLQPEWCTGMSDGYHKLTFNMKPGASSDVSTGPLCRQFILVPVQSTTLYILVLANRTIHACSEKTACSSCSPPVSVSRYHLPLARCQYCLQGNMSTRCQCQCYCDVDFDQCQSQYRRVGADFPTAACYYPPAEPSPEFHQLLEPDHPGPADNISPCQVHCASIEDMDDCKTHSHCKVSDDKYPVCVWDDSVTTTTVAASQSPKGPQRPPTRPSPPNRPPTHASPPNRPPTHTSPPNRPPTHTSPSNRPPTHNSQPNRPSTIPPAPSQTPTQPTASVVQTTSKPEQTTSSPSSPFSAGAGTTAPSLQGEDDGPGMSPGAIAGLVIGLLILTAVGVFIVIKLYGKKSRRPGIDETTDKYRTRNSLFDSTLFNRSEDSVTMGTAPGSTVPYHEMSSNGLTT